MLRSRSIAIPFNPTLHAKRFARARAYRNAYRAVSVSAPTLIALLFASAAQAQGTMDFSGAKTLMGTFNSRFAYVSVSRASFDAQIYTNDATTLAKSLSRDVSKASAVDVGNTLKPAPIPALEKNQTTVSSNGLGLAL